MTTHHSVEKKPARGGLIENGPMNKLDYVEQRSSKTLEVARQTYDDLHERGYKLATVLVAGGGAVAAYALSNAAGEKGVLSWAPLGAMALSWFGIAGQLVWVGLTSRDVSPGNAARNLLGYFDARIDAGQDDQSALLETRKAELDLEQIRFDDYKAGCISRATAIDLAYKSIAVVSPIAPLAVIGAIKFFGL